MPCHIDVRESPVASGACRLSRKKTWHGRRFGTSVMGTRRSYPCLLYTSAETDRAVAPSVSCEAVEAFKQAYADRSCGGNRRGCGCR